MKEKFKERLKQLKSKKGFTLIELIVVIAVLAILVLLAAPKFLGHTKDANVAAMQADAKVLSNAALVHNVNHDVGKFLDDGEGGNVYAEPWPVDATNENNEVSYTITVEGEEVEGTLVAFEEGALKKEVRTLKNPITDYALAIDGEYEGQVFYIGNNGEGLKDSNEVKYYGVDKAE